MADTKISALAAASAAAAANELPINEAGTNKKLTLAQVAALLANTAFIRGADIASAATLNLDAATGNLVDVTGVVTVTAITLTDGWIRTVRFTGILVLTNGASLVLPGAANITTAVGDFAVFRGYAAGVVRCTQYSRAARSPDADFTTSFLLMGG